MGHAPSAATSQEGRKASSGRGGGRGDRREESRAVFLEGKCEEKEKWLRGEHEEK